MQWWPGQKSAQLAANRLIGLGSCDFLYTFWQEGTFLVRMSQTDDETYSISVVCVSDCGGGGGRGGVRVHSVSRSLHSFFSDSQDGQVRHIRVISSDDGFCIKCVAFGAIVLGVCPVTSRLLPYFLPFFLSSRPPYSKADKPCPTIEALIIEKQGEKIKSKCVVVRRAVYCFFAFVNSSWPYSTPTGSTAMSPRRRCC